MKAYLRDDLRRGFSWLGHAGQYTEMSVLHPLYQAGDVGWNRRHRAWPIVDYVTSLAGLESVVRQYHGERLVCYGLNPRPTILTKRGGGLRSARDADIRVSQNLVLDLDLEGAVTSERLAALHGFLDGADEYFASVGLLRPVRALTGRGCHLLFAYPPIAVAEVADVQYRLRSFREGFFAAMRHDLSRLEARLDSTQDLRRVVRVYGTAKPDVGIVSRFCGESRVTDAALRAYLVGVACWTESWGAESCCTQSIAQDFERLMASAPGLQLPSWFAALLEQDAGLRSLWRGEGKRGGDVSESGYDYSIMRSLVRRGHGDPQELGTILLLRPGGGARQKGSGYIARTVLNAISCCTKPVVSS